MLKRIFDLFCAILLLILFWPLILFISILLIFFQGHPIIFKQIRHGKGLKTFTIYKFRSMTGMLDKDGRPIPDDKRLTFLGRVLRSTSFDELPTLINVIKGDMSMVGPRPLLTEYMELYTARQARRHEVNPGVTGWAQVNGRNAVPWDEKLEMDVWYVDNRTFMLDIRILLKTLVKIVLREGISQDGHATAEKFRGSQVTSAEKYLRGE